MLASLRDRILPLADDTVVLPGHGPATTIGRERATNPYLRQVMERDGAPAAGPDRGW
jgi:glyoxylase-like metal-dependent hydrolase (beta-lactamase superfamily II)